MKITLKTRLRPSGSQKKTLNDDFFISKFLYNHLVQKEIDIQFMVNTRIRQLPEEKRTKKAINSIDREYDYAQYKELTNLSDLYGLRGQFSSELMNHQANKARVTKQNIIRKRAGGESAKIHFQRNISSIGYQNMKFEEKDGKFFISYPKMKKRIALTERGKRNLELLKTCKKHESTISKDTKGYYVNLVIDKPLENIKKTGKSVGIDFGVKDFLTLFEKAGKKESHFKINLSEDKSTKDKILKNQRAFSRLVEFMKKRPEYIKELKKLTDKYPKEYGQLMSYYAKLKSIRGDLPKHLKEIKSLNDDIFEKHMTKNMEKLNDANTKLYAKQTRQKNDQLHKITTQLVKYYDIICIEKLNIQGMTKKPKVKEDGKRKNVKQKSGLNRKILEKAPYRLKQMLEYKAKLYGKTLIAIPQNKKFASSKICSNCGKKNEDLKLSDRTFNCKHCSLSIDRDVNAAKNLVLWGLKAEKLGLKAV